MKQIKDNNTEFEQGHLEIVNFVKENDQNTVDQEEALFDEYVNHVAELIERLEKFEFSDKIPSTPMTARHLLELKLILSSDLKGVKRTSIC